MKTCLICDDHALVREALGGSISINWPEALIDFAVDFDDAWVKAKLHPEIIICDLIMPGAAPLAGIDGLIESAPNAKVLVVTGTEDDALLLDLLDKGVAGFTPKSASTALIEAAIRLIIAGGRYLPPRLADIASARIDDGSVRPIRDNVAQISERLSVRQMDVLKLVATGKSNKEIARALNLAPSTVKTHLGYVMAALNASNRTDASIKARMLNLF